MKLHTKLFAALVLGIVLGAVLNARADLPWIVWVNGNVLRPIGQIFLRSIFMIVVPMVFAALSVEASVAARSSHGGTAPAEVRKRIAEARQALGMES